MVRVRRLELPHLSIPEPKSGASTNSATPAQVCPKYLGDAAIARYLSGGQHIYQ